MNHSKALFREDSYLTECSAKVVEIDQNGILLDQTVFYPQGGRQIGDIGSLSFQDGSSLEIIDTQKYYSDNSSVENIVHIYDRNRNNNIQNILKVGDIVTCNINWNRRFNIMRLHTAAHLLCKILPYQINGCNITDTHARMDFVTNDILNKEIITKELQHLVKESKDVMANWTSRSEIDSNPDFVRTLFVKPPINLERIRIIEIDGIDRQPCGGTHIANTSEIGNVLVAKMKKVSAMSRRVTIEFSNSNDAVSNVSSFTS